MTSQAADVSVAETSKALDSRLRLAGDGNKHYVSICGDNFAGPFKTREAAATYGSDWLRLLDKSPAGATP